MDELSFFAVKICLIAVLICAIFSAIIAKLLVWRVPTLEHQKVAFLASIILPGLIAVAIFFGLIMDSFNPEPITGPQAQGGLIVGIVFFGLVLVGIPVGYISARQTLALSTRK